MPGPTYTPLANITLSSSASSITFSSIPGTYKDLILVMNAKSASGGAQCLVRLNSDSGTNYRYVRMVGNGVNTQSFSDTGTGLTLSGVRTDFGTFSHQIFDYSATDKHKVALSWSSIGTHETALRINRWASNSAVNSITLSVVSPNTLDSTSTLALYGIAG